MQKIVFKPIINELPLFLSISNRCHNHALCALGTKTKSGVEFTIKIYNQITAVKHLKGFNQRATNIDYQSKKREKMRILSYTFAASFSKTWF